LLQADISPQKLSRRSAMAIREGSSGSLYQHRDGQVGAAERVRYSPFFAEIRQRYDNAVDTVPILTK
jgi:hypothetical protein